MNQTTVKFRQGFGPDKIFSTISINPSGGFMVIIEQIRGPNGNLTRSTCIPSDIIQSVIVEQQN